MGDEHGLLPVAWTPRQGVMMEPEVEALRIGLVIETASSRIVAARNLLDHFRTMITAKMPDDLASWIRDAAEGELASFASGIQADEAAVKAVIVGPWSHGQTEGHVTKLELVKRQM